MKTEYNMPMSIVPQNGEEGNVDHAAMAYV
jgi:hypothetical protein